MKCLNTLEDVCKAKIRRFPKLCLDLAIKENPNGSIKVLWTCAYTECARGDIAIEKYLKTIKKKICQH